MARAVAEMTVALQFLLLSAPAISTIHCMIADHAVGANDFGLVTQESKSGGQSISFLVYAVMVKNKLATEALLPSGADVNLKTPDHWSAMAEAARSPDDSLLPLLLSRGGET